MIPQFAPDWADTAVLTGYTNDLPMAQGFLLLTQEFFVTTLITRDVMWACDPISGEDARNARTCTKTGMMVPAHAIEWFDGKPYSPGRAPTSRPEWFRT